MPCCFFTRRAITIPLHRSKILLVCWKSPLSSIIITSFLVILWIKVTQMQKKNWLVFISSPCFSPELFYQFIWWWGRTWWWGWVSIIKTSFIITPLHNYLHSKFQKWLNYLLILNNSITKLEKTPRSPQNQKKSNHMKKNNLQSNILIILLLQVQKNLSLRFLSI